jgi:predicted amidohydrolase YtcJ
MHERVTFRSPTGATQGGVMASRLTTFIITLIVAGTVIAGLIVGAQRDDASGRVDLIVTNGRVFTGDGGKLAEAVAIQGNKILRVGSNRVIKRLRRPETLMLDAHGAAVLPGLIDTHVHLAAASLGRAGLDLTGASSLQHVQQRLGEYAQTHPESVWIRGRGWSYSLFENGLPTREMLDEAAAERAAFLVASDGRTGWASSRALELAGITRHTPNPKGGVIVKDPATGEPTGALIDAAQDLLVQALPEVTRAERLEGLRQAIDEAHSMGITSVHSIADTPADIELYAAERAADMLRLRVYSALAVTPADREAQIGRLDTLRERYPDDPVLKTGAAVLTRDAEANDRAGSADAPAVVTELSRTIELLDAHGWQTIVEPRTDAELAGSLDGFERARNANEAPARGRRHRLEHISALDLPTAERIAQLGLTLSLRPTMEGFDPAVPKLGSTSRVRLTFGSDWPFTPIDPRLVMAAVTDAPPALHVPANDAAPVDPLPIDRVLQAFTADAAWASFDEQRKGKLARGMLADLVILTSDIFAPGRRVRDVEVDTTIFDGKVVYSRTPGLGTH